MTIASLIDVFHGKAHVSVLYLVFCWRIFRKGVSPIFIHTKVFGVCAAVHCAVLTNTPYGYTSTYFVFLGP